MSYILDALRKADAQRERDPAARGIHAQPVRVAVGQPRLRRGYGIWLRTAIAVGVVVLASAGWYFYRDGAAGPVAPPVRAEIAAAAPAAAIAAPAAAVPADAVLPPPVVVAPPAPVTVPAAKPVEAAPAAAAKGNESSKGVPASAATAKRAEPAPRQSAGASASAPAAAAATVADAAPIAGLPADAPKLAISGGVYSANAAQRMLIVNGQVFNEGSEVGPGLVLEEIRAKAAVIRFRGARYTVAY